MKELLIITGANHSGKTTFSYKHETNYTIVNTDEIPDENMSLDDKIELVNSLLEDNNKVLMEGRQFFDEELLSYCCELDDCNTKVVIAMYDEAVALEKYTTAGDTQYEYLKDDEVRELESAGIWCDLCERLMNLYEDYEDVNILLLDVTDYNSWDEAEELFVSSNTSQPHVVPDAIKSLELAIQDQMDGKEPEPDNETNVETIPPSVSVEKSPVKTTQSQAKKELMRTTSKEIETTKSHVLIAKDTGCWDVYIPVDYKGSKTVIKDGIEYYVEEVSTLSAHIFEQKPTKKEQETKPVIEPNKPAKETTKTNKTLKQDKPKASKTIEVSSESLEELKEQKSDIDQLIKQARQAGDIDKVNELRKTRRKLRAKINSLKE